MTDTTNVWASLAMSQSVQFGVPYIDPNSMQPTVDGLNFTFQPLIGSNFSGVLSVGTQGDLTGTDSVSTGGQHDSYMPTTLMNVNNVGQVPGFTVSASRGTRLLPTVIQGGDLIGYFSAYGLVQIATINQYAELAGIHFYCDGADLLNPGGKMRFGTKTNAGVFAELIELDSLGNFAPFAASVAGTPNPVRLGKANKGFGALALDYINSATIGAVQINKPTGSCNIGAGTSSVVVTNSLVTVNSLVIAWLMGIDGTLTFIKAVVPANGSFTITGNANATGNVKVGFLVINTDS